MAVLQRSGVVENYLRTTPPAPSLPWWQASFVVLGLDATCPDTPRDRLVSVAWVPVEGGRGIVAKAAETTIRPGAEVLEPIVEALTGRVLVAHGASRHSSFLGAVLERTGLRLAGQALDTGALARWVLPRAPAEGDRSWSRADIPPRLSEAALAIGLPVHRPQEAGGEALTTAQLFLALVSKLDRVHPQTVGSLARLCVKNRACNRRPTR